MAGSIGRVWAIVLIGSGLSIAGAARGDLMGYWEFDNPSNPGQATVGSDLVFQGALPTYWASLADDNALTLSGAITTAPALNANRVAATHGIAPNGGGAFVNQYTIVADIFSPLASRSAWRTIYQTNTSNTNDGDYFIRNDNDRLGVGDIGYSTLPIDETAWTRLAITVDLTLAGGDIKTWLNGALHYVHPGNPAADGRYSLDPAMFFFTDNDGDNAPLNVGALAIFGTTLSAAEIAQLGGPGTSMLPVPEPAAGCTWVLAAALATIRRRGKKV